MLLSPNYSRVAIFDTATPGTRSKGVGSHDINYFYEIGEFQYKVTFFVHMFGDWYVSFSMNKALGSPEQQVKTWSRVMKREVTPEEAAHFLDDPFHIPDKIRYGVTGSGNAYKILAAVISAIKDFRQSHPDADCINFSADKEHQSIYRSLLKRYDRYFDTVDEKPNSFERDRAMFKICFHGKPW